MDRFGALNSCRAQTSSGAALVVGCPPGRLPVVETTHANSFLQRVTVDVFDSALSDDALAAVDAFDSGVRGVANRDDSDFRRPA